MIEQPIAGLLWHGVSNAAVSSTVRRPGRRYGTFETPMHVHGGIDGASGQAVRRPDLAVITFLHDLAMAGSCLRGCLWRLASAR